VNTWTQTEFNRWAKKDKDNSLIVLEVNDNGKTIVVDEQTVHLNEHTETIEEFADTYYTSLEHMKEMYGSDWEYLVLDCVVKKNNNIVFDSTNRNEVTDYMLNNYAIAT